MSEPRFFVEGLHQAGETLTFDRSDAHKIVAVLRKRSGDTVEIIDSAARFSATLDVDGRAVRAKLRERRATAGPGAIEVTVAQGIPKAQKMDFVVEKLTELGAGSIVPLQSERTMTGRNAKLERWRRLAKTAAAQCGRDRVPTIADPQTFDELLRSFSSYDLVLFPWELAKEKPLRESLERMVAGARRILVIVGPEGGFSHAEAEAAQRTGAQTISLGPRILRTETAALVVLALLNYVVGV